MSKFHVITRFIGRSKLKLSHASPTILTVGGIAGLVTAGVLAVKASPKMDEVVHNLEVALDHIKTSVEDKTLHEDDEAAAKFGAYVGFSLETVRVYGAPLAIGCVGAAAILYSHGIMRKREASLMAAYGVLERAYNAYRARVVESFGEDVDQDIYNGKVIKNQTYDKKSGKIEYDAEKPQDDRGSVPADYRREFGPMNKNWNEARSEWNLVFLRGQEKFANHLLQSRGHVFLNDVFDGLGFDRTPAGAVTGWVKDGPDGYIDFGLPEAGSPEEQDYFYFFDGVDGILLEFNVDGLIYDKI